MAYVLGMNAKLYRCATLINDSDNTPALATWILIGNVRDLTLNLETGEADITTRGNDGWRQTAATLKDGSLEFEMVWDPGDAAFTAVQTAWDTPTEIGIAALDGAEDAAGSQGLAGNFSVTNFTRTEPLEEALIAAVTLKPSSYNTWYTVSA